MLIVWLAIISAETVHGVLRALFLEPSVGDFRTRRIGVLVGAALILLIAHLFSPWLRARSAGTLPGTGLAWVALTAAFEAALGRLALNLSWERIFSDYDVSPGGLMGFGPVSLALAPLIAARLRAKTVRS